MSQNDKRIIKNDNDQVNPDAANGVPPQNPCPAARVERIVRPCDSVTKSPERKCLADFPSDVQRRILAEIKRKHGEVKDGEYHFDIESLVVNFSPSESLRLYDPDYQLLKIRD